MNLRNVLGWSLVSIATIGLGMPAGCSSSEAPPDGGGGTAGAAGTAGAGGTGELDGEVADVSLEDVASSEASPSVEAGDALTDPLGEVGDAGSCDNCGAPRFTGDCTTSEDACLANSSCAAIRNCVFSGGDSAAPCTLGPSGAACVEACIQTFCTDSASANLYRTLDHCAYCSVCAAPCSSYCGGFGDGGVDSGATGCGIDQ